MKDTGNGFHISGRLQFSHILAFISLLVSLATGGNSIRQGQEWAQERATQQAQIDAANLKIAQQQLEMDRCKARMAAIEDSQAAPNETRYYRR